MIGSTIGCVSKAWISSGSAGDTCPGSPRTPTNTRFGLMEWVYWNGDGWREGKRNLEAAGSNCVHNLTAAVSIFFKIGL